MPNNIVQIDLTKLDEEISSIDRDIEMLVKKKNQKIDLREYIKTISTPLPVPTFKAKTFSAVEQVLGISDFLVNYIKDNKDIETRLLVDAYSLYLGKPAKDVYNNVANALSRLKSQGRIDFKVNETARGEWYFIK